MNIEVTEEERQILLLGLSRICGGSPGFTWFCRQIAIKLQGQEMFECFLKLSEKTPRAAFHHESLLKLGESEPRQQTVPWEPMDGGLTPVKRREPT